MCSYMNLQWCWQTTPWCVKCGIKRRFWQAAVSHMLVWTVPIALTTFSITTVFAANWVHTFSFLNPMMQNIQLSPVFFVTFCGGIYMAHLWPSVFGRTRSCWGYQVAHSSSPFPRLFGTINRFSNHLHWTLNYTWNLFLFHRQFFTKNDSVSAIAPKISLRPNMATKGCCIIHVFFTGIHKMGE